MAEKVPIRAIYNGSDTCGLSELRVGEVVGVEHGGLGACTLTTNGVLLGNTQGAVQVSSALTTNGQILIGGTSGPAVANVTGTTNEVEITSGDGSITIGLPSTVSGLTNVSATNLTGTLATAAQANVTSVGTLTSLNSSGNVSFDGGSFVFNESGADKDFRIEGDSNANLFMADASVDRIGIGTATPSHLLDVEGVAHVATCIVTPKVCITSQYALPAADGSAGQLMCTDGSGAIAFAEAASSGHTIANAGSVLASRTCLNFVGTAVTATDNSGTDATDVTICATNAFLPVREADGTACCVTLATAAVGECLQSDTSPKLGGSLDVNGNSIISASNGNIPITPNGSGIVIIDGLCHPIADGSAGQLLCTDGSAALKFATVAATSPGGSDTHVQFNDGGSFGGAAGLTWDDTTFKASNICTAGTATLATVDINAGAIDGTAIGANSASTIAGTTLSATGNVSFDGGSFVFNESGADKDFRIEGDTEQNLFFADASTDRIGIGTSSPTDTLNVHFSAASMTEGLVLYNENTAGFGPAIRFESDHGSSRGIHGAVGANADGDGGSLSFYSSADDSALTRNMVIKPDGKVGIGTATPDVLLHLEQGTDTTTGTLPSARFERTGASQTGVVLRSNGIDGLILRADSAGFGAIHSYEDLGFYTGATPGSSYGNVRMRIETTSANSQGTGVTFIDCCANYVVIGGLPATGSKGMVFQWENGSDQGIINAIHTGTAWKPISISQNANLCVNAGSGYTAFGADYGRIVTCTESGACSRFIINVCSDSATAPMAHFHARGMCMSGCFCIPYCICANTCIGSPTKNFEIEHPLASDESPNKYNRMHLVHSTLEGPEYGVYYRGSSKLDSGAVKVDLPEYFEALAEKTDATVQLTSVGGISNLTIKLDDENIFTNNSFCVCTDDAGSQTQCFHWIVNGRRIDKHILCNIAQGDRPGACDDGRLCTTRWEYRGEMENINGLESMTCAELDDLINFNNTWDSNDPDFVTGYENVSKANKIIMIGNAFDAIQNSAEGGKEDFSEEEEE